LTSVQVKSETQSGPAGFTLLELLVAISVFGLIVMLLTQGVQFGLQAMAAQAAFRDRHADLEMVDRALRRLIALAHPGVYPEPPTLRGTARSLSLTTELPTAVAGTSRQADVILGLEAGRLVMRWTPRLHVEQFGPAPAWRTTVVLDGVDGLEFTYSAGGAWRTTWAAARLPRLIMIRILFAKGTGRRWPPIIAAPVREAIEQ